MTSSHKAVRLVILGRTGVGKSSLCNTITRGHAFETDVGASSVTLAGNSELVVRDGRTLLIVDTAGIDCTSQADMDVQSYMAMTAPGPHVFIHVVLRLGQGRYLRGDEETALQYKRQFGPNFMNHLILVFTGEDALKYEDMSIDEFVSDCPSSLQKLLAECNNRYLTVDNRGPDNDKEVFTNKLLCMVDSIINVNGHYTMEMFEAQQRRLKTEEDAKTKETNEEENKTRDDFEEKMKEDLIERETEIENFEGLLMDHLILHCKRQYQQTNDIIAYNQKLLVEFRRRTDIYETQNAIHMNTEMSREASESIDIQKLESKLNVYAFGVAMGELAQRMNSEGGRTESEDEHHSEPEEEDICGSDESEI